MKIEKLIFEESEWQVEEVENTFDRLAVCIVFVFANIDTLKAYKHSKLLKQRYPNASIVGCSTAGNILDATVDAYDAVASAVSFEHGYVQIAKKHLHAEHISEDTHDLVDSFEKQNLKHIFLLSPGLINGSDIVNGIDIDESITISGGLAGDAYKFENTNLFADEEEGENLLIAIGFYGASLHVSIGCNTGWNEFGAARTVTKSLKNCVYEIDGKPAIELYEKYLGDKINELPNSALRFPLSVKEHIDDKNEVIMVMMGINPDKSLVYAGDIQEGSVIRLMKTNVSNLLEGAALSAKGVEKYNDKPSLSLAVSCSARRSVLKQFSDEELDIINTILPENTEVIGFYSYGEIAPFSNELSKSLLHNQTMTITTIYED